MKKLLLVFPIILAGCVNGQFATRERNEKCMDIQEVEVLQVLNDGALAYVCERKSYDDCAMGMTVAVLKERGEDLWDKKRIKVPNDKCFIQDGVYKYTSKDERSRTVPIIRLDYAYSPATEKEMIGRIEDLRTNLYHECLDAANAEFKNSKDTNIKKCECFADLTIDKIIDAFESSEDGAKVKDIMGEKFVKGLIAETEKKCGKLPKSMKL